MSLAAPLKADARLRKGPSAGQRMAQDRNRRDAGAERQPVGRETAPEDGFKSALHGCGVGVRVTRRTLRGSPRETDCACPFQSNTGETPHDRASTPADDR